MDYKDEIIRKLREALCYYAERRHVIDQDAIKLDGTNAFIMKFADSYGAERLNLIENGNIARLALK